MSTKMKCKKCGRIAESKYKHVLQSCKGDILMEQKTSKNTKLLLVINTIRKIIDIFLGPFLTAYLFKVAVENIKIISIYNIFSYIAIAIIALIIGRILKNKYEMQIFRIGMISKFIQLAILIILGDNVVNYIWILAIIAGFSTETWSFPLNLFSSRLVSNDEKKNFVVYKIILNNLVKVLIPFLLGSIITVKNFETTAMIILILSFIQILLSFKMKFKRENNNENKKLNIIKEVNHIRNNKKLQRFYMIKFFKGMAYEGALDTAVTLLIIMSFNSDFSLGVITSIISLLAMLSSYAYKRIKNQEKMKLLIIVSFIIILISSIMLVFITNQYTIVGYNLIFAFFLQFIMVVEEIQTLKFTNSDVINDLNRVETYVLLEMFLNAGRIISYILLFIVGIYNNLYLLEILIIFLVISIGAETINLIKFNKE